MFLVTFYVGWVYEIDHPAPYGSSPKPYGSATTPSPISVTEEKIKNEFSETIIFRYNCKKNWPDMIIASIYRGRCFRN